MKRLRVLVVIFVAYTLGLGFHRGWFQLSTEGSDHEADVKIRVDRDRMQEDEERIKESVHELGHKPDAAVDDKPAPPGAPR